MITHHEHAQLTELHVLGGLIEGATLPAHFTATCESRQAAQILAAKLGSDYTVIFDDKAPQVIECIGRRVSEAILP